MWGFVEFVQAEQGTGNWHCWGQ